MEINQIIHGFKLERIEDVAEIKATAYFFIHQKTQAKCLWLKRDDENKTFSISFKTTPTDDTGVFHIMEHSVLNGSQRYPVKEPFVDLLKGSLQTFLNAMTFQDKTMYPVSSRNEQDFINLTRVYLDAVFYPNCVNNSYVFKQEGWHYELNDKNQDPLIKGVVYNEMKGAYSSSERVASQKLCSELFPDNCYHFSSGGDPEHIPELTYEQFCQAHDTYYSATNSFIIFDGAVDIEKMLGIVDDEYLSKMSENPNEIEFEYQNPVVSKNNEIEFESTTEENKAICSFGYVVGDYSESEKMIAFNVISSLLTENNQSILKKAILDKKLGQDVCFSLEDSILQPYVEISVTNTNKDKFAEIEKTIIETLNEVVESGFDKEEMLAILNKMEFSAKERDFGGATKGLVFAMQALGTWLYGGDPIQGIAVNEVFKSLKEKVQTSYFEDLVKEFILNSKHNASVVAIPSLTLAKEKEEAMSKKMKEVKANLSDEQLDELLAFNKDFSNWQKSVDSKEQKATLPKLTLADLPEKPTNIIKEIKEINGVKVISYPDNADGISYYNLYFNISDFTLEQLQHVSTIASLLGLLDTNKHSCMLLNRLRKNYLGSLSFAVQFNGIMDSDDYNSYFVVSYSCLDQNNQKAWELVREILKDTYLVDKEEITNLLTQNKNDMETDFVGSGHRYGMGRAQAHFNEVAYCKEACSGYDYYNYLKKHCDNVNKEYLEELIHLYAMIFDNSRLTLSCMGACQEEACNLITSSLPTSNLLLVKNVRGVAKEDRDGIVIPAKISYATMAIQPQENLRNLKGKLAVISKILSFDFLWSKIRAQGGAYGSGIINRDKMMIYYSYRDPNPANSLQVYPTTKQYLLDFVKSDDDLTNYIIGTVGDLDPLLTNRTKMLAGDSIYLSKSTYERACQNYKQVVTITKQEIEKLAEIFEPSKFEKSICVVGPEETIKACGIEQINRL